MTSFHGYQRRYPANVGREHPFDDLFKKGDPDQAEPTKYWLSTLPADTALVDLVKTAKMRWRIADSSLLTRMIFTETRLKGAFVIEPEKLEDERGFFARTWDDLYSRPNISEFYLI